MKRVYIDLGQSDSILKKKELEMEIWGKTIILEGIGESNNFLEEFIVKGVLSNISPLGEGKYHLYFGELSESGDTSIIVYELVITKTKLLIKVRSRERDTMPLDEFITIEKNVFFKKNQIKIEINQKLQNIYIGEEKILPLDTYRDFVFTPVTSKYQKVVFFKALVVSGLVLLFLLFYGLTQIPDIFNGEEKLNHINEKLKQEQKIIEKKRKVLKQLIEEGK
jgi:hypothetical protein